MWKRLANHLRMNDQGGLRNPPAELTMVLLDFAARRRRQAPSLERFLLRRDVITELMRIRGVGAHYAELLEAAGFRLPDLRRYRPRVLARRLETVNRVRRIARRPPSPTQVESWIRQAKDLEPTIRP